MAAGWVAVQEMSASHFLILPPSLPIPVPKHPSQAIIMSAKPSEHLRETEPRIQGLCDCLSLNTLKNNAIHVQLGPCQTNSDALGSTMGVPLT